MAAKIHTLLLPYHFHIYFPQFIKPEVFRQITYTCYHFIPFWHLLYLLLTLYVVSHMVSIFLLHLDNINLLWELNRQHSPVNCFKFIKYKFGLRQHFCPCFYPCCSQQLIIILLIKIANRLIVFYNYLSWKFIHQYIFFLLLFNLYEFSKLLLRLKCHYILNE